MLNKEGSATNIEAVVRTKDGSLLTVILNAQEIIFEGRRHLLTVTFDITELKRVEEESRLHRDELAHVTRVATMGEMATNIAHELNQPLTALSAYIGGILRRVKSGEPINEAIIKALKNAMEQAERAGEIIRRLRDFIGKRETRSEIVDINEAVRSATKFMRSELDLNQIDLVLALTKKHLPVEGDAILIQQVILNLIKNSVDALNKMESGSGRITVNTTRENGLVSVVIDDNGSGVPPDLQDRLFEPYFSTKNSGLGLGLPICRSIIEKFNGKIWCEPAATQGTAFQFDIPLSGSDVLK